MLNCFFTNRRRNFDSRRNFHCLSGCSAFWLAGSVTGKVTWQMRRRRRRSTEEQLLNFSPATLLFLLWPGSWILSWLLVRKPALTERRLSLGRKKARRRGRGGRVKRRRPLIGYTGGAGAGLWGTRGWEAAGGFGFLMVTNMQNKKHFSGHKVTWCIQV